MSTRWVRSSDYLKKALRIDNAIWAVWGSVPDRFPNRLCRAFLQGIGSILPTIEASNRTFAWWENACSILRRLTASIVVIKEQDNLLIALEPLKLPLNRAFCRCGTIWY